MMIFFCGTAVWRGSYWRFCCVGAPFRGYCSMAALQHSGTVSAELHYDGTSLAVQQYGRVFWRYRSKADVVRGAL